MSWKIIKSIKYSVIPYLTIGSFIITNYKCSAHGEVYTEERGLTANACIQHNNIEQEFYALLFSGVILLITLPIYQYLSDKAFMKITVKERNFYKSISNLDRKRWIAEEHYRRTKLGINTISDSTYQSLIDT